MPTFATLSHITFDYDYTHALVLIMTTSRVDDATQKSIELNR